MNLSATHYRRCIALLLLATLPQMARAQVTTTQNYLRTTTVVQDGVTTETQLDALPVKGRQQQVMYFDGLGRPIQQVQVQQSPGGGDVVVPTVYDAYGRTPTTYLPYTLPSGSLGAYQPAALSQQTTFYQAGAVGSLNVAHDTQPFATTVFEASPLNRPIEQGAPGAAWQPAAGGSGHTLKFLRRPNTAGEVRQWVCGTVKSIFSPGFYAPGQLAVVETTDENGHLSLEFTDGQGRVVQKKVQEATSASAASPAASFLITQYLHDDLGNLRMVIQPQGTRNLPTPAGAGQLSREVWLDPTGAPASPSVQAIALDNIPSYFPAPNPVPPNGVSALAIFEAPTNVGSNYGQCVRGYVTAPMDGFYTFWIASDDNSELWLSTSETPSQRRRIASVNNWTNPRDWEVNPATQRSEQIRLEAGKRYYVEALMKEAGGDDNLAVGWQLPDGSLERPIPATRLSTDFIRLDPAFIDTWCFRYEYDARRRVTEKQVPGAGVEQVVYNGRDQPILTQRANQSGEWLCTKYDPLGRPILTGSYYNYLSRAQLQTQADASTVQWEDRVPNAANLAQYDYSLTRSFPTDFADYYLLSRTYYDDYGHTALAGGGFVAENGLTTDSRSLDVRGQVTGRSEHVVGGDTNPWLTSAFYYDAKYRPIQTQQDLYSGTSSTASGTERTTKAIVDGLVTSSLVTHNYPSNNQASMPQHTVLQEFTYDDAGRLLDTRQQVDSQNKLLLSRQVYNELGQLVDKKLHSTDWNTVSTPSWANFLQSVDYRYNIRGWLSNINDRNLSNNGSAFNGADPNVDTPYEQPDLFGMELMYNQNQNLPTSTAQYNGNVSEVMWKTNNPATGNALRGYSYQYDPANRIGSADYRTYNYNPQGGTYQWGIYNNQNFSVAGITYDANGNLRTMNRLGCTSAPGATAAWGALDNLTYAYEGNRLVAVDDPVATAAVHDFEDVTGPYTSGSSAAEYTYDAAGNVESDRNKRIDYISYNVLNKPEYIYFNGYSQWIRYAYSASGVKLWKYTVDYLGSTVEHVTDYAGGFVYEDKNLTFAATPEGRMLYTANPNTTPALRWKYEYHLKDHLGNLRVAFTDEGGTRLQRTASMEPVNAGKEEQEFAHVADTRLRDAAHARTGDYVARLDARSGRRQGPSIRLAVTAGDSVHAEVYGRYDHVAPLAALAQKGAVVTGAGVSGTASTAATDQQQAVPSRRSWLPFIGASVAILPQLLHLHRAPVPMAYLRYELFAKDSQLVATRTLPVQRTSTDTWQQLTTDLRVDSTGYVQVSLVNESGAPVYFDDLQLRLVSPSLQENHYDPFGLNLVGIESSSVDRPDSKFQYNGKEKQEDFGLNWTDYGARMFDAQLGRWRVTDSKAQLMESVSPYIYSLNNPINFIDKDGELPIYINGHVSSDSERGSATYWDKQILTTIASSGIPNPGRTRIFIDGDIGALNFSTRPFFTTSEASDPVFRRNAGEETAKQNFQNILAQLQRDPKTGKLIEKIQIYTHSRGGAFGAGFADELLNLIRDNANLFADPNHVVDFVLNLAPHQSNSIIAAKGSNSYSIDHDWDMLSGDDMENNIGFQTSTQDGHLGSSHENGTFVREVGAFIKSFQESKGANQKVIDRFVSQMRSMGITVTVEQ